MSAGECREGLPTVCVCVCVSICLLVDVHVWSCGGLLCEYGGGGVMQRSEGGMDINHDEKHGSVALHRDGWGVSAVMSP